MTDKLNQSHSNPKIILIVDDELSILQVLEQFIKRLRPNYQVMTATDGMAAWILLQQQAFDLLVTDYEMPQINGLQLIQRTRQILPEIPVMLMSGQSEIDLQSKIQSLEWVTFIAKPFTLIQFNTELKILGL